MLKKIVGLSIVCVILLTVAAGGTWAFMSDTGKSSANQIKAGKLNLLTGVSYDGNPPSSYVNGLSQTLNVTNLKPNQSTPSVAVYLKNDIISNAGSTVGIRFAYTESDTNQNGTPNMSADSTAAIFQITTLDYNRSQNLLNLISDWNGNGYIDVQDLQTATNGANHQLNGLSGISPGLNKPVQIQLKMRYLDQYGAPIVNINDFQGDGFNLTLYFTLNQ